MIVLLAACLLSLLAVCGLGVAALRLLHIADLSRLTLTDAGISGLTILGGTGIVLNFVTPLNAWVTGFTMLVALACALRYRMSLYRMLGNAPLIALFTLTTLTLAVTLGALRAPLHPDTGIYHFQTI